MERIHNQDEHAGKGGRWKATPGTVGKGRIQTADIFRIHEHDILQGVEDENLEDDMSEDLYDSHCASISLGVPLLVGSRKQQQQQNDTKSNGLRHTYKP